MGVGANAGLHTVVNELPIVFLLAAPVFVVLGIALQERGRVLLVIALVLMLLGTASLMSAVATGDAARAVATTTSESRLLLEEHRRLAEDARNTFLVATAVFCVLFLMVSGLQLRIAEVPAGLSIAFLTFYALGVFILLDAARHGLRLAGSSQ